MSFLSTAARAIRLAREYSDATDAALKAIEEGSSLSCVVFSFASRTENQIDDQAAEILIEGLEKAIEAAEAAAHLAAIYSPKLSEWGVQALKIERKLRELRG